MAEKSIRPAVERPHLMKLPKRARRFWMTGLRRFWPIRCPWCRQFTNQELEGYTPEGGQIRRCRSCGETFTRKESRDAQKLGR